MGEMLLEWKDHDKALSTKLWEFFNEEYLVDFNVTCHGQQTKVHKFVLALLFPILKESLRSTVAFSLDQEEPIPEAQGLNLDNIADHPEDMIYLLQFAYTGQTTVPKEHAECLMHIADSMEIKSLKDSLGQLHFESKLTGTTERNDDTPQSRLRKRTQFKKVIVKSEDSLDTDNDFDHDWSDEEMIDKDLKVKKLSESMKQNLSPRKRPVAKRKRPLSIGKREEKNTKRPIETPEKIDEPTENGQAKLTSETDSQNDKIEDKKEATDLKHKFRECKYCDYKSIQRQNLLKHIKVVHKVDGEGNPLERNVKCSECEFTCYANHQLNAHFRRKHEVTDKFKCKECHYNAPNKCTLTKHIRIMHEHRRDHMCDECGFRFQTRGSLNKHVMIIHRGVKPYKCDICGVEYSHTFNFKLHKQKHTGEITKNHVCHICGHSYSRRDHLRLHYRTKHKLELPSAKANYQITKHFI